LHEYSPEIDMAGLYPHGYKLRRYVDMEAQFVAVALYNANKGTAKLCPYF
jgi:hypothetical protein